jgi:RNA polymerase sigma-70 factor (ECF subfamily)
MTRPAASGEAWLIATTRAGGERRTIPFSALADAEAGDDARAVEADRFLPADHDRWPHHWALGPMHWETPEDGLLSGETRRRLLEAVRDLPPAQRTVITRRDIEGWPAHEVCDALEVSEGNQRELLHRARSKVHRALEAYFGAVEPTAA